MRLLILLGFGVWFAGRGNLLADKPWPGAVTTPHSTQAPLPPPAKVLPDADALARRLPFEQDDYERTRGAALAAFAAAHPGAHPWDAEARQLLKLEVYLSIWGDYYGEGWWPIAEAHAASLQSGACPDAMWRALMALASFAGRHSMDDDDVHALNTAAGDFGRTAYPPLLKVAVDLAAIKNMIAAKNDPNVQMAVGRSLGELPGVLADTSGAFRGMILGHASHVALFRLGHDLLHAAEKDEPTLQQLHAGFDGAFAAADPASAQAAVLDGDFQISDAWNARGVGNADAVTPAARQLFGARLKIAADILQRVYARAPAEPGAALSMMTVCLGEGLPLDVLDTWYERGRQAGGDPYVLAYAKGYYLMPKWYGSDEAAWNFGLECAKGGDWAARVPTLLEDAIHERAVHDTALFAQPETWQPLEQMFRGYLARYPDSAHYRSLFALEAAFGGHWDVAKEQFKILGDDWDPHVCGEGTHQRMESEAEAR
jgi:hypothetical protein